MKPIKSADVAAPLFDKFDSLLREVAEAEAMVAPVPGDLPDSVATDVPSLTPAQITALYNTLRRLRAQINETQVKLYESGLDMPIDRLCTVIGSNLDGYTNREASNLAETLYGPTLIEGLRPFDRVKVCKEILRFFTRRKITPPIPYWDLLVTNNGFVK